MSYRARCRGRRRERVRRLVRGLYRHLHAIQTYYEYRFAAMYEISRDPRVVAMPEHGDDA